MAELSRRRHQDEGSLCIAPLVHQADASLHWFKPRSASDRRRPDEFVERVASGDSCRCRTDGSSGGLAGFGGLRREKAFRGSPLGFLGGAKMRRAEGQYLVAVAGERLAPLLRLKVGVTRGGLGVAVIQHIADQMQRTAILGEPGAHRAPQVMDADILQPRPFAATRRSASPRLVRVRAGLEATNDVRIPLHPRYEFETADRSIA